MRNRPSSDPLNDEEPIPGTSRARVALAAGVVLLVGIVAFLAWFIVMNWRRGEATGIFG